MRTVTFILSFGMIVQFFLFQIFKQAIQETTQALDFEWSGVSMESEPA